MSPACDEYECSIENTKDIIERFGNLRDLVVILSDTVKFEEEKILHTGDKESLDRYG